MIDSSDPSRPDAPTLSGQDLAALVAGKLCHDFISPAGAVVSGLDLLKDPTAQDMRDDAMGLIEQSAAKMVSLVHFARVAFGAATSAERFSNAELKALVVGMTSGGRAAMDWAVEEADFAKPAARALVNLAYLTVGALPLGGLAVIRSRREGGLLVLEGVAEGSRARLKPEAEAGLAGRRLGEGLPGQWIQPYWLWLTATGAGGDLAFVAEDGRVTITARLPV